MRQIINTDLHDLVSAIVDNIDPEWLSSESATYSTELNVRLSPIVYYERQKPIEHSHHDAIPDDWSKLWAQYELDRYEPLIIAPGQFVLAETLERISMPKNVKGVFTLRSWVAKSGLDQAVSITLKPGWSGHLVMELRNNLQHSSLCLRPKASIGQIEFFQLDAFCNGPSAGERLCATT
jgi:deoxycytidine triphosphate deaminase